MGGEHESLLHGLNPAQREAVTSEAAPLCILAGAGSGKTRALTRRIAWRVQTGSADPRHVLALTFTRRAAGELGARLAQLGVRDQVAAGTFHSLAYAQLRRRWAERGERPPALLDRKVRLIVPLLPRRSASGPGARWVQPGDVASEIEWAKARMVAPADYEIEAAAAGRRPPLPAPAIAGIYRRYEDEKRRRALVDFDDLLLACADAIESDPEFAATQRWRFRHLFVDEFQDVNPAQFRLLEAWRSGRADLCVVGDPNQAIYAWNGADPTILTGFPTRYRGASVVHLDDNYRSTPQVLAVANVVVGGRHRLRAHEPDGPLPTVTSFPTDREEAVGVARAVRRHHGAGRPWSDHAVLTRTHAQLVLFEEALRAARIPFRVRGSARFLSQPEVRDALGQLKRLPPATPLADALPDLLDMAHEAQAVANDGEPAERVANLESLARLAREHLAAEPGAAVAGFLSWLVAALRGDEPDTGADAVELATLHAAKGLEWPVVFVAGLEQGLIPIGHAETPEARAEERRLLYVGLTRARRELHCSWAEKRTFGARTMSRTPSPYLERIEAAVQALAEGRPVPDWQEHLAKTRAQLRAATPTGPQVGRNADPKMLEALKLWRAATARASGVPAYVVFHDTTLAAVAEAKPRDRAGLLALPGVGPVKVERYGDELLSLVAQAAG